MCRWATAWDTYRNWNGHRAQRERRITGKLHFRVTVRHNKSNLKHATLTTSALLLLPNTKCISTRTRNFTLGVTTQLAISRGHVYEYISFYGQQRHHRPHSLSTPESADWPPCDCERLHSTPRQLPQNRATSDRPGSRPGRWMFPSFPLFSHRRLRSWTRTFHHAAQLQLLRI